CSRCGPGGRWGRRKGGGTGRAWARVGRRRRRTGRDTWTRGRAFAGSSAASGLPAWAVPSRSFPSRSLLPRCLTERGSGGPGASIGKQIRETHGVDAAESRDGVIVLVDAQIVQRVLLRFHQPHCGGLLAALVACRRLPRFTCGQQALG